jgi:putative membrane protein
MNRQADTLQRGSFVAQALASGRNEAAAAEQAQRRARSTEDRDLARMLKTGHQGANEKLVALKGQKEAATATSPSSRTEDPMRDVSAADFDRRYVETQIEGHRKSIALFRKQANDGTDPRVEQFARDALPTLEKQLRELERIQGGFARAPQQVSERPDEMP